MDLEDLIKGKHHKHGHRDHDDHDDHRGHYDRHDHNDHDYGRRDHSYGKGYYKGHYKLEMIRSLISALPHKKALLAGAIIVCALVLILGIVFLWMLFPLMIKLLGYVETNGIEGVVNYVLSLLQLFWKGNG